MIGLVVRRFLEAIPALLVVSIIMFGLLALGPNPLELLKQNPNITSKDVARLTKLNGWDKPVAQQYVHWGSKFIKGDMGVSTVDQRPAWDKIKERLPLTLMLTGMSMVLSLMIALPIGAYVAVHKYSRADYVATLSTFAMMASPSFFIGLLLQLFALKLQDWNGGSLWFFTGGAPMCVGGGGGGGMIHTMASCAATPIEVFRRLALPVFALSILQIAGWSRYMRSELLGVLNQDYIRSAMAKGLNGRLVFMRHAVRNALLPLVTIVALDVATLFGGATITERVFGLPGMGNLLLDALGNKDIAVVLAIVMIGAALVLFMNTVADVLYGVLDPRVRVG
ncbi:MAG: binding-protein-dependent transport system inner rane component [Thermoleophilia bacterium]|nr:binding-protein-dependent transport system inner rane component [Thermoleophilia bacterium]